MKIFILYFILFLSSNIKNTEINISTITKITKDLISGIFEELKGETWVLPDTCLNKEFEDNINNFLRHLKKLQTVFCFGYLQKITYIDAFTNCPADQIVFLFNDIDASVKSGQIYINSIINVRKIFSLIVETIKDKKIDSNDIGRFFGKLINLIVYGKSSLKSLGLEGDDNSEILSKIDKTNKYAVEFTYNLLNLLKIDINIILDELINQNGEITKIFIKYHENKIISPSWVNILDILFDKYERNKLSTVIKKFIIFTLTSFELFKELIININHESIGEKQILNIIDFISIMLRPIK